VDLSGRLAVVTGGARRLGRALVEALAADGARPVIHYHHSRDEALALALATGGHAVHADLSAPDGPRHLIEGVRATGAEVAVWINSAATFLRAPFLDSDDDLWARTLQLSVLSPASLARAAAPLMVAGGAIINILDVAAHQPWRGYAHHSVGKAALLMLTRCLAAELAPAVRVCAISPGPLLPPEGEHDPAWDALVRQLPLRRAGAASDLVAAVRFLLASEFITGVVLPVDGGMLVRSPV
jgi:NAD(P)-dependent dehydrogenase (short-subunit alcohol dehydrogenase family)